MQEAHPANCPSFVEHAVLAIASLIILEQHSRLPEANFVAVITCGATIVGVTVAYFVRVVTCTRREANAAPLRPQAVFSWLIVPATIAMLLCSAATHWPATVRFYLSKPSFDELIAQAYRGERPEGFPRRVGLYWVEYVYDVDFNYETRQGTVGFVSGVALIDECGIYYDPGNPTSSHWLTTRIAPRWYLTEW